jgi:PAS domain S-box-containing protein
VFPEPKPPEAALRGSEGHYRLLFDKNPLPAWVFDLNTLGFLAVNEAAVRHFGYSRQEFQGLALRDVHPTEDLPALHDHLASAPPEGEEKSGTWRHRTRDGAILSVELAWQDITFGGRRARLVLARDVTRRRQAEEELRESERRLRQLAEHIRAVFWMTDARNALLLYVSPMYEEVWGRSCESLYQKPASWQEAIHPEDREAAARVFGSFLRDGRAYEQEYRVVQPDGTLRWVRDRGFPVHDLAGRVYRVAGFAEDVTALKLADERLRREDRRKDEFLAMLAHELRNPLAPLRNALHILRQSGVIGPTAEQMRELMERQVRHLSRLVENLVDVSRLTRGCIELHRESLDLTRVVHGVVEATRPLVQERCLDLTLSLPGGPVWLEADPTRLEQIVSNLLSNAVKYTDPGGQVRVELRTEGGEAVLRVRDTGVGIAPEMVPQVFDLFVQGERRLDRSQGGVGIGLTLVRRLVELHDGKAEVTSAGPGKGSEFVIRLPLAAATGDRAGEP